MIKELKYFFYIFTIAVFIIFIANYYFSDENKKKSYRSFQSIDKKNDAFTANLSILESDTENIIEYVENTKNKDRKKYKFWELLFDDKR